jgi:hypothetical protein
VANVTSQVIERHLVRELDTILSPLNVANMDDTEIMAVASEPAAVKRQREFLSDRQEKLTNGKDIFRNVMGSVKA